MRFDFKWINLPKHLTSDMIEYILNIRGYITQNEFRDMLEGDLTLYYETIIEANKESGSK